MNKTVVVTGGAGYIGSHTCKALSKVGILPVTIDNLERGHRDFVKWGPFCRGDYGDSKFLEEVFHTYKPIAVIHIAGYAYVQESYVFPDLYYRNNVLKSLVLFETMKKCSINQIIFSSTCSIYGEAVENIISEDHPQNPINPYGKSKLVVEWMIKDFAKSFGFKYGILRYFNAAGADLEGEIGERHDPETHLIPILIDAAYNGKTVSIFGFDFPTFDGSCVRDYVHVQDLADAHVKVVDHLLKNGASFELNLGSGRGISVMEMVQNIEKVTGKKILIDISSRRLGDAASLIASQTLAKKLLGWEPKYSDIETIIASASNWISLS